MSELMFHATARLGREIHILRTDSILEALAYAEKGTEGGTVAVLKDDELMAFQEVVAK